MLLADVDKDGLAVLADGGDSAGDQLLWFWVGGGGLLCGGF